MGLVPWARGASGAGPGCLVLLAQLRAGGDDAGEEGGGFFELEELDGLADLPSAGADERFQLAPLFAPQRAGADVVLVEKLA